MKLRAATGAPILLIKRLRTVEDARRAGVMAWYGRAGRSRHRSSIADGESLQREVFRPTCSYSWPHEGSVCLYFPAQKLLIAGDTLFCPQHRTHRSSGGSFEKIIRSLHDRVLTCPTTHL